MARHARKTCSPPLTLRGIVWCVILGSVAVQCILHWGRRLMSACRGLVCTACVHSVNHSGSWLTRRFATKDVMVSAPPYSVVDGKSRVYQLGFSKTGTTSIWAWYGIQGYKSRHFNYGELYSTVTSGRSLHQVYPDTVLFTNIVSNTGAELSPDQVRQIWSADYYATFIYTYMSPQNWRAKLTQHPELLLPTLASGRCNDRVSCIHVRLHDLTKFHEYMTSSTAPPHHSVDVTNATSRSLLEASLGMQIPIPTHHQPTFWSWVTDPCVDACHLRTLL